ncbi:MAG TPA: hypothetical protein VJT16_02425 [Streptosporangiaceae bacterium]|nr:hypothetical protein [Streptosporangiaceae bacterium]
MTPRQAHRWASDPALCADERAWQYSEVACGRCGAVVEVAKFSLQHTSVQWTAESVLMCEEFSSRVAKGGSSALTASCASLRASIDAALADGRLEVLPP